MNPKLLHTFQAVTAILVIALVIGSFFAVWWMKGAFFFAWNAALGPLSILVSAFGLGTFAWTITWERNKAVEKFSDREIGGRR